MGRGKKLTKIVSNNIIKTEYKSPMDTIAKAEPKFLHFSGTIEASRFWLLMYGTKNTQKIAVNIKNETI